MIPLRDTIPHSHFPKLVLLLIFVNFGVFLLQASLHPDALQSLIYTFGIVPARFSDPRWAASAGLASHDYLPFVTNMFLHGGWLHVISNMWSLWLFGDNVEDRMGSVRFLLFYLLCGIAASAAHYFSDASSTIPAVGASGAIAGVMGAYFRLFPHAKVLALVPFFGFLTTAHVPAVLYLGLWFVTQLLSGAATLSIEGQGGGIAFWAHIGGFAAGFLLHPLFLSRRRVEQARELARQLDRRGRLDRWGGWRRSA